MDAPYILCDALDARGRTFLRALKGYRHTFSVKAVHRLRVAARRVLSLADLIRRLAPQAAHARKLRKLMKGQLRGFNALRDTQVMLAGLSDGGHLRGLTRFRKRLLQDEACQSVEARCLARALDADKVARLLAKVRADAAEAAPGLDRFLLEMDEAYAEVMRRYRLIRRLRPASMHRARVAFKTFRYLLEIARPLLPGYPAARLKRVRAYQESLGGIQDAETLLRALREFGAPAAAIRGAAQRQSALIAAYFEAKGELADFWRARADEPFPWESRIDRIG
jgi:CHAD domain-containing protein